MRGLFTDRKILIIGGTGTIGKGILMRVLAENPQVVRLLSRDEYKQFQLQQQLREYDNIRFLIGDVRDPNRVQRAMQDIDYVFHCAAMKHVPSCEYNPFEAVQTNVFGTQNVIQAAIHAGVKRTIFTSTDKAISPTNTYGASKLMSERLITAAQNQTGSSKSVFAAVRFGNVMGSRGSVIPLFKSQILNHREITVTDKEMTRFMMTIRQATDLTVQAMEMAQGGEVFVLKMPIIRLEDLAEVLIDEMSRRYNLRSSEVRIKEIGIRPGEKMYEELMTEEESRHAIELPEMFVIPSQFVESKPFYRGAKKAHLGSYSSHHEMPIDRNSVRKLLAEEQLFEMEAGSFA